MMEGAHLIHETPELEHCKKAMLFHSDRADAVTVKNERLMRALKNILLEFDFMVENGLIADTRGDIIFVEARAALQPKEGNK